MWKWTCYIHEQFIVCGKNNGCPHLQILLIKYDSSQITEYGRVSYSQIISQAKW